MRAFSVLATITAFALSVSAASLNKRAISGNVQSCVDNLADYNAPLLNITNYLSDFVGSSGYSDVGGIVHREQDLDAVLRNTGKACCAITTTFSNEEANAVYNEVGDFVPNIIKTFEIINYKKTEFDAVPLITTLFKGYIKSLSGLFKQVDGCLIAVTPNDILSRAQAYVDTIDANIVASYAVYNITT